jgi:transposase
MTIYGWIERKKETGDVKAKIGYQKGYGNKVKDLNKFCEFVKENNGATLSDMVRKSGIKMSIMTCSRILRKINITRKKRHLDTKKGMRTCEKNS